MKQGEVMLMYATLSFYLKWHPCGKNQCRKLQAKLDIFHTAYAPFAQFKEQSDY